jgi:hypothetical protein
VEFCHLQRQFRKGACIGAPPPAPVASAGRGTLHQTTEEAAMGFMDKAKKLAEQAQQKLDEAQNQFNQGTPQQSQQQGGEVRYDEHGRPIQEGPPAGTAPPPPAQPTAAPPPAPDPNAGFGSAPSAPDAATPASPSAPAAPADPPAPEAEQRAPAEPPPVAPSGGANESPDPFKPLQQ